MSYIAVLGAGAWGTSIAKLLGEKDFDVALWAFEEDVVRDIKETGINSTYMPEVKLPDTIKPSSDLAEVLRSARYVVNVIPTQFTRSVLKQAAPDISPDAVIISASKGIEMDTYKTVSGIIGEILDNKIAVISGPSFAAEVTKRRPTAVTLASDDYNVCLHLQEIFNTDYFRVYSHHDMLGVELGGALKNVMAIAAGIAEGLGLGNSARASLITRGLAEMIRLGVSMGAKEHTFSGLSGLGDLVLTCNSTLSRNFTVGLKLGQGQTLKDIVAGTRSVAEGVATTKSVHELARRQDVEMPIAAQIYKVLYEGKSPKEAVTDLMNRSLKAEFYG